MNFCYFSNSDINWTTHGLKSSTTGPAPKVLPPFTLSKGPTPRTKQEKSPLQVFQLFITTILLEGIRSPFRGTKGLHWNEYCYGHAQTAADKRLLGP